MYMDQVAALRDVLLEEGHELRVIAAEGDSVDETKKTLRAEARYHGLELELLECSHGGPEFGSTEAPERMQALSKVCNAIFEGVRPSDRALLYVESDLQWPPQTMLRLLGLVGQHEKAIFSPLIMAGECFYDIWGFRTLDGTRFSPFAPFALGLNGAHFEVSSVGSCLAIPGGAARKCRVRNQNCLVGWCEDARAHGYSVWVVPELRVRQA
jgi:hypothetical protein